ncbi:DsbA family protein [Pseudocitrobacter faecalis]|uniref:DsbA family protein n=1 Tax=Pseudocitrobacter faecalis TaxID=1398493 RepID=UPI003BA3B5DF
MTYRYKRISIIGYSLFLIIISSLMTVLCYHLFVFNTFKSDDNQTLPFREISAAQVADSPITEENSIIEVMSYGCHYCAANEENLSNFAKGLPAGYKFKSIHIADDSNGLAAFASVFATLEEMGIEEKMRDSAYNAVITRGINISNEKALKDWLKKNNISLSDYKHANDSTAVKQRLQEMAEITKFYNINATPMFIINKRYVVAQDRDFPEFAQRMMQLLEKDK